MKITWLGQGGLLFEQDGFTVMVDPYLSDSVKMVNPDNYRRVPVDERFLCITPNVLVLTHSHLDHTDPDTLKVLLECQQSITVLAPYEAWDIVRKHGKQHNYVLFDRGTEWTEGNACFSAVKAVHSDKTAVGVVIKWGDKTYYITGDTLYSNSIFAELPHSIDAAFLPINGVGNNMNMTDAAGFAAKLNAKSIVPFHFGMFDNLDPAKFDCPNKIIPQIYKEIAL